MRHRGFSLLELSIVLVIIGLLAGGVVAGQSLIRASEIRGVISERETFYTALHAFRLKYNGWPGDLRNATSYWGEAHSNPTTCRTTQGAGTATCNGNGDGIVGIVPSLSDHYEVFFFWKQLANAGMISGTYTGIRGPAGNNDHFPGVNTPASKMSNGGWAVGYNPYYVGDSYTFANNYQQSFAFGKRTPGDTPNGLLLSPVEAWHIDEKVDDGMPNQGKAIVVNWPACTDATGTTSTIAKYKLSSVANQCSFEIKW